MSHTHFQEYTLAHGPMKMDTNDTDMMPMYFVWSSDVSYMLFEFWTVHTPLVYAITLIVLFLAALFNQFLFMIVRRKIAYRSADGYTPLDAPNKAKRIFWLALKPIAFMFQNALSYLLMLAVMTFNVGVFIAVVVGSTVGYTIFSMPNSIAPEEGCH